MSAMMICENADICTDEECNYKIHKKPHEYIKVGCDYHCDKARTRRLKLEGRCRNYLLSALEKLES